MTAAALLTIAGAACPALADTAVLTIDPAQSSIDVEATLIAVVGDRTDTASTSVSGTIEVEPTITAPPPPSPSSTSSSSSTTTSH